MRIAVTGAGGFIGRELVSVLQAHGHAVRALRRVDLNVEQPDTAACREAFDRCDAVIHLAARAHVIAETATDPLAQFRRVNVAGALGVAEAAAAAGVRRFVFVSSIGVCGNETDVRPFSELSVPAPVEPYAVSKHEAEIALRELQQRTGLEVVSVRPPLVYGPDVKGNFLRLLQLIRSGAPLPLGSVRNLRSYIGVTNLCALLAASATQPLHGHTLFVAADGQDLSTPELLRLLGAQMQCPVRVFRFPVGVLQSIASVLRRDREMRSLTRSLQVDAGLARSELGWRPLKSVEAGMLEMTTWFRNKNR